MVFMTPEYSLSAWSQISNVHVKYEASGIENNIRIANSPCSSDSYLQNEKLILICQEKKGIGYKLSFSSMHLIYKTRNCRCTLPLQLFIWFCMISKNKMVKILITKTIMNISLDRLSNLSRDIVFSIKHLKFREAKPASILTYILTW